jgi:3-oxoacyl-[acyl-carrier-protein] synthase II
MTSSPESRVVVTGLGAVSPWGWSLEELRCGLARDETRIGPFDRFDHRDFATHVAAQVPPVPFTVARRFADWARLSNSDRFAVVAADEAVRAAGLPPELSASGAGVFFGSSTGGLFESETAYNRLRREPSASAPRAAFAAQPASRPGDAVARALRVSGTVETVSTSCASGTLAVGLALRALRAGEVRLALAGGADSLCRITYGGFNALGLVCSEPCHPFRGEADGLSLGEGGAVLVLETLANATARGVRPLAELAGAGSSGDAYQMTAPEPEGLGAVRAVRNALRDAGRSPEEVELLNAHGTGTALNDAAEYRALERVFGSRLAAVPLVATKASVGHLLGAAGALEAVATVLALRDQALQPTAGAGDVRAGMSLRLSRAAAPADLGSAVSLSLGFGGCNAALVLVRWSEG